VSVYVIGASGHGKVVVATLQAAGVVVAGVLDDDPAKHGLRVLGVPVQGPSEMALDSEHAVVVAVGSNATRKSFVDLLDCRVAWSTGVHPAATVHPSVEIGEGTVVFAGAVIQPDSVIGRHVIINTSAAVDHDCRISDYVHAAPGVRVAGDVLLGEGVFMGVGACAIQGVHVGDWATLGAGAVAIRDVPAGVTAVGVPARSL
jgi:sugar O-acyltransferase (sialic acid O-acetyltransferase NeuD family)